ncbi:MAG: ATP-binding protein [Victivallales bacterium]|nr:ATP-binding protein [Victivallales bacterium]
MKELVIISGKGGTGKTSLTASFAALAGNAVLADCDVDAADLHLLLHPRVKAEHQFICGHEAILDPDRCTGCGDCLTRCRFDAIGIAADHKITIDPYSCEGCGVCVHFCPARAIAFPARRCGEWYESETNYGAMVHAKLAPAAENSGKLVAQVRQAARQLAEQRNSNMIIVDGPPGIGCPVIAALGGASAVLIVTEPTVSGEHDLERVLQLAGHFEVPALVCINKWDLNPETAARIEQSAAAAGATPVGRVPYDTMFTTAMVNGRLAVHYADSEASKNIVKVWEKICRII